MMMETMDPPPLQCVTPNSSPASGSHKIVDKDATDNNNTDANTNDTSNSNIVSSKCDTGDGTKSKRTAFPMILHQMLDDANAQDFASIVSWYPLRGSTFFRVHNQKVFVNDILPRYFSHNKYKSFQRQLNLWGFERVTQGKSKGAYGHRFFVQGEPDLCKKMSRRKFGSSSPNANPTTPSCSSASICVNPTSASRTELDDSMTSNDSRRSSVMDYALPTMSNRRGELEKMSLSEDLPSFVDKRRMSPNASTEVLGRLSRSSGATNQTHADPANATLQSQWDQLSLQQPPTGGLSFAGGYPQQQAEPCMSAPSVALRPATASPQMQPQGQAQQHPMMSGVGARNGQRLVDYGWVRSSASPSPSPSMSMAMATATHASTPSMPFRSVAQHPPQSKLRPQFTHINTAIAKAHEKGGELVPFEGKQFYFVDGALASSSEHSTGSFLGAVAALDSNLLPSHFPAAKNGDQQSSHSNMPL